MKEIAIISLTRRGASLGRRLHRQLPQSDLFAPSRFAARKNGEQVYDEPLPELIKGLFGRYQNIVMITAVAVAVRTVAPLLRGKKSDPGLVVMDERGRFAVSVLGGHSRRSNQLAAKLAFLSGAQPVVTTASDINNLPSLDLLGDKFGWRLEADNNMARVIAAMVNNEVFGWYQDAGETNWGRDKLPSGAIRCGSIGQIRSGEFAAALIISDRAPDLSALPPVIIYRPASLTVGIGCHAGITLAEIGAAIDDIFSSNGLARQSIAAIATIDIRRAEPAIIEYARKNGLKLEYFSSDELGEAGLVSPPSLPALSAVGTPGVAEPAALLAAVDGDIIIPKVKTGNLTVAVARRRYNDGGKLYIVGTGPGNTSELTVNARRVIDECDVVLGYRVYLRYIQELLAGKEVVSSEMRQELDRAKLAIEMARGGRRVALVSGGDPGVYGMSAAVFELLENGSGGKLDVEVVPGVPAVCAVAARLGAPLSGDFACVSLSDLLTPWEIIVRRLHAAASAEFIIAIYNPRSRGRPGYLAEARRIILEYRSPQTVIGLVRNAFRDGEEEVIISDLEHMLNHDANMFTTLLVGNESTVIGKTGLLTPRGYRRKYDGR